MPFQANLNINNTEDLSTGMLAESVGKPSSGSPSKIEHPLSVLTEKLESGAIAIKEPQGIKPRFLGCVHCLDMQELRNTMINLKTSHKVSSPIANELKPKYIVCVPNNISAESNMRTDPRRSGFLIDQFIGKDQSVVETMYQAQTTGILPGIEEKLSVANENYFSQWTRNAQTIELDENVDICFMPYRLGTRSSQATQECFMCTPEPDRIYTFNTEKPIGYTFNSKPYTNQIHMLIFPTDHQPQEYDQEIFKDCLEKIANHAAQQLEHDKKPSWTALFAGPVGGSQPHQHWHLLSKNTRVEQCVDHPKNLKQLTFDTDARNGIYHVQSDLLKDLSGQIFQDPKRGEMRYFDCIMVRGTQEFLARESKKIVDHFGEPQQHINEAGETLTLPRSLYNLAILPPDKQGRNRLIVFPRSPLPEHHQVERSILWGENKSFNPSAHEMAGHWFMTQKPKNKQGDTEAVFNHKVKAAFYKTANDIRVPVSMLELDSLYKDQITFHQPFNLVRHPELDTDGHEAVSWYGWGGQPNAEAQPLLTSLKKPDNTQGADIEHIVPVLNQQQVNDLYKVLKGTHEALVDLEIPYFAGAGSLMGAIRHGGQMWNDDDGDFFLRNTDFDKVSKLAGAKLAEKGLRMQPGWPGFQISKIDSPSRADGTGVPFVDLCFMDPFVENGEKYWRHVDSPEVRGEASGPTFIHQVPVDTLDENITQDFQFGKSNNYPGIPLRVPSEKVSIDYLDRTYGKNWFEVLKTRVHNHIEGTQAQSVTLSIQNHGHLAPKL